VAYGESDDTIFHHGATECSVVITLEGGKRIEWSRKLKGSPKVLYRLFHGEDMIHEGRPSTRGGVPEWVSDELGISRVDELDIQIGSQKCPIFLLDETPSRRAQLLSVGRESRHLHKFIERYRDWQRRDKETSREGEAELIRLNFSLAKLAGLPGIGEGLGGLTRPLMDLESQVQRDALLAKLLGRLDTSTAALGSLSQETTLLSILPEAPALADMTGLGRNIERLEKFTPRALVKAEFVDVAVPVIADTVRLGGAITHIAALEKQAARAKLLPQIEVAVPAIVDNVRLGHAITRLATLEKQAGRAKLLPPSAPATPELCPLDALVKTATAIERAAVALRTAEAAFKQLDAQIVELLFEIEQTKELTGGECPLCGAAFPEHGIEHKHNAPTAERLVA
jgi:hypothetical protein